MTGMPDSTASRISESTGGIHGRSSFTLMGPPIKQMPETPLRCAGTASPASMRTSRQGMPWRSRNVAKYPGPSVGEWRNIRTGYMMAFKRRTTVPILAVAAFSCTAAAAASVSVVGLFKDKAIVSIDGGKPRTLSVGQAAQGVKLLAADSSGASFDVDGKRRTLGMGQSFAGGVQP